MHFFHGEKVKGVWMRHFVGERSNGDLYGQEVQGEIVSEEVRKETGGMKTGKSPGVTAELLKYRRKALVKWMLNIMYVGMEAGKSA